MKKVFTLITLGFFTLSFSQSSIFYDATYFKQIISQNNGNFQLTPDTKKILVNYFGEGNQSVLTSKIESNPFLKKYFLDPNASGDTPLNLSGIAAPSSIASLGSLDVTKFADGLAKFIVDRTKKELQAAFFDRFIEEMNNDKYKDIQNLFPTTYQVVKRLPTAIYSYEPYIELLRDAFGKDLETIYPHLEYVLKNGTYASFFDNHLELKSVCLSALYFGNGLKKGKHIGLLLEEYQTTNTDYNFSDPSLNTIKNNAILFVQEVSKSLRGASSSTEYWVSSEQISAMINDPITFDLYLGLLYQKVVTIPMSDTGTTNYGDLLIDLDKTKAFIETLISAIEDAQNQLSTINSIPIKKRTPEDYYKCFEAATKVLAVFNDSSFIQNFCTGTLNPAQNENIQTFWKHYEDIVDGSNAAFSLYINIKAKKYSLAMSNVKTLYQLCFSSEAISNDKVKVEKIGNKDVDTKEAIRRLNEIVSFLIEKGAFIAEVAKAKNSTEVYNVIDKIAAPVGSSRVKRLAKTNVAINAYCGFFVGKEIIKDAPIDGEKLNTYGLTAPVGFSFSKGNSILPWPLHGVFECPGWSSTLFFSVIDIGAVASYRFTNSTADQVPTIELKDIFSPGLFWSVGIPKTPLSLNFGAQVGPNLRKVNGDTDNTYAKNTYLRYSVSIVVDIPLLNLYTKSK